MNIDVYIEEATIKHVSVNGEIISRGEIDSLLSVLEDEKINKLNITFFDANIIQAEIVERLDYLIKNKECRIYVFKRYLYSYLYGLGISCEYVSEKCLRKENLYSNMEELINQSDINRFLENINSRYGYDYREYQPDSILRRIRICMLRQNIRDFDEFQSTVLGDVKLFEQLFQDFSINTTEFFRDPEVFLVVRNKLLPYLDSCRHIKIWSVGCSNGKEAYSLAIILAELGLLGRTQIYATDINPYVIEEAKNGLFSINNLDGDILNYKKAGGERNFIDYFELKENYIKIKNYLRKNILFFPQSLIGSGSFNEFNLILCRNVLIYFNSDLQKKVLKNFYNSLDRSGFLVLGKSEGMILNDGERYFTKYLDKEKIYKIRQI